MTNDIDIKLLGYNELTEVLRNLDYATQHKILKSILRNTGTKEIIPYVKRVTPQGQTGNLKRSIGNVTGRSKINATVFVGPRMSHKRSMGSNEYSGWVANILEYAKGTDRFPEKAKAFKPFSGGAGGPAFYKKVSGIKKRTNLTFAIKSRLHPAEVYIEKATRTVIERAWRSKTKKFGLAAYAEAKGR